MFRLTTVMEMRRLKGQLMRLILSRCTSQQNWHLYIMVS